MKSILITFDQSYLETITGILQHMNCRGYSLIDTVKGQGSKSGEPHMGSHAWPGMCSAIISVVDDNKVDPILEQLHKLDKETEQLGLRAFVWNIEKSI